MQHSTDPFEHWIIDDFLPEEMASAAARHFYEGDGEWIRREHLYCKNKRTRTAGVSEQVEAALTALECPGMLAYISALTGVKDLHSDPMRFGGGQHVTTRGGRLGIHADFTHHPTTGMRRALNLLLYLNYSGASGALELWSVDMKERRTWVVPEFNRAVIFETSTTSFHGHPDPFMGKERLSLAVYYYIEDSPGSAHDWLRTTDYRPRPWEYGLRLRKWLSTHIKGGSK
jgi:hypothetical protein